MPSGTVFGSRRLRSTPYTPRVEAIGVESYTVYNHMMLPMVYTTLEQHYHHLKRHVQIWDVAVERQVEIKGKDALKLVTLLCARDVSKPTPGRGYYTAICDHTGALLNDPIALCLAEDHWWLSIADSDLLFWVLGVVYGLGLDVQVSEPDVSPLAIQGPKAEDLVAEVMGETVRDLKYFRFKTINFLGMDMVVQRSGWSKQGGFEIYMPKFEKGLELWDAFWEAGRNDTYQLEAGAPNHIERMEGGLLSYGNDLNRGDTPLECDLAKFTHLDRDTDFIGKEALLRQREQGIEKKMMGLIMEGAPTSVLSHPYDVMVGGQKVGFVTSACYSPDMDANIGFAFLAIEHANVGCEVTVMAPEGPLKSRVTTLPFVTQ